MKIITDKQKIEGLLSRGVNEAIDFESLKKKLLSGRKLRVKLGIDPTSPDLHLGRAIPLLKLKDFQDLGHQVVFIVGDFTGLIGDTSDKDAERPMLAESQIKNNMKSYARQAGKILDLSKAEIHYNSKWLKKLGFAEIGKLANQFSLAEFAARENIKKRYDQGKRISLREVLYPLMQGYDSVAVKADVEIGGTDQRFNLLAGRTLQSVYGQTPQDILMNNLILGLDGRKMSSSWGNTINLTDKPEEMYGKIMSLDDRLIISYFIHCTRISQEQAELYQKQLETGANPRDIKMSLALEITGFFWSKKEALKAEERFISVFQDKKQPVDMEEFPLAGKPIVEALEQSKLAASKSEAKRLIAEKGVKVNNIVVSDFNQIVLRGDIVQKGKRHFIKVK